MSVTVTAAPLYLLLGLGSIVNMTAAVAREAMNGTVSSISKLHLEKEELEQLLSKEFETKILDSEVLLKTLKEHGATNIKLGKDNSITCECDLFYVSFVKPEKDKDYNMTITYDKEKDINEFVENIGIEYTLNAQEESYKKIKERLQVQNLEISDEEIYDDNTIVLTVDLE